MQGGEKLSLEQIRALLQASQEVRFAGHGRAEVYAWIGKTLAEHNYRQQKAFRIRVVSEHGNWSRTGSQPKPESRSPLRGLSACLIVRTQPLWPSDLIARRRAGDWRSYRQ